MHAGSNRIRSKGRGATTLALAIGCTGLAIGTGVAGAAKGGTPGGIQAPPPPAITAVTCSTRCLDLTTVAETGTIEIQGTSLAATETVKLKGTDGKLSVRPTEVTEELVTAKVPLGAASGKVSVVTDAGIKTASPEPPASTHYPFPTSVPNHCPAPRQASPIPASPRDFARRCLRINDFHKPTNLIHNMATTAFPLLLCHINHTSG